MAQPTTSTRGREQATGGDLWARVAAPLAAIDRAPLASFHVIWGVAGLLSAIGLGMVLASSNVLAYAHGGGSPFGIFLRQAMFVVLGWGAFYLALRMRMETLRRLALPMLLVGIALLGAVLVPGVGSEVNGSRGWINLGLFSIQPAEIAKLAFIVWASVVVSRRMRTGQWKDLLWPSALGFAVVAGLIVVAPDLGMATSTAVAFLVLLWFAGYPARHFAWILGIGVAGFAVLASTMAYRFARVKTFVDTFTGDFSNPQGDAYQSYQGVLSLADGGLFGVGLGQSSAKWFYLPEATNDFIFAIIGEELGWVGAGAVVCLYLVLGWAGLRVAQRSVDPARRLLAGTLTCTIVLQAFINVGYVVGLLPVTGLQLPLISNGGTSAVVTLFSLGLVANCARHEPEAISAILSSPRRPRGRWYSLPAPRPYVPERPVAPSGLPGRSNEAGSRYGAPVRRPVADSRRIPEAGRTPQRSGGGSMTGRTARPVRAREQALEAVETRRRAAAREAVEEAARSLGRDDPRAAVRRRPERPTSIHRGRTR